MAWCLAGSEDVIHIRLGNGYISEADTKAVFLLLSRKLRRGWQLRQPIRIPPAHFPNYHCLGFSPDLIKSEFMGAGPGESAYLTSFPDKSRVEVMRFLAWRGTSMNWATAIPPTACPGHPPMSVASCLVECGVSSGICRITSQ